MGENTEQTTNRKTETTAQMNELNKALLELKKITGISLEVSGAAPEQIEPALTQINFRRNIEKSTVLPFKNLYRSPYGNAACSHTSALPKRDV